MPENDKGSRIIVTTRIDSVAQAVGLQQGHMYSLDPLNADDSHRLLQRTLGDLTDCQTSIILEKCGGLPLSIVAVTGLLVNRLASGSSLITACGSLSSEVEKGAAQEENLNNILNLCYNDLPGELKTGFLFLRIFPVGSCISRKRLIRRWIAEGFITDKHGRTLEQVAEELFVGLIRRNLIQPVDISISGKVKTFQVHHVILENILSKSREENFISIVNSYSSGLELPQNKVRWLSIHRSSNSLYPKKIMKDINSLHIRSLTAFGTMKHLKYFEILQVLDLEGCIDLGTGQLSMICKMCLLKYLSLRRTYIKALPPRICRLQCLEMLDIRETNVSRLPRNAGRLKQMVRLLGGDKSRGLALKFTRAITKMSKLQTLSGIMVPARGWGSTAGLDGMGNLTNLNKLSVYMETHPKFLYNCSSLTSLSIDDRFTDCLDALDALDGMPDSFNNLHILKLSGKLCRVPHWIKHMQCLEELTLSLTSLKTDSLELLSNLPRLSFLSFSVRPGKQYPHLLVILQENISESGGEIFIPCGFQGLHSLHFSGPAIPLLSFLQGSMPALQMLELRFRMFDGVYGLQNLANLQKLHLGVSKQASELTKEKVRQFISSVNQHPRRPMVIRDEYHEC